MNNHQGRWTEGERTHWANEEARLAEQCRSSSYIGVANLLDFLLKASMTRLVTANGELPTPSGPEDKEPKKKEEEEPPPLCNYLKPGGSPNNPPNYLADSWLGRRIWSKAHVATNFIIYYSFVKCLLVAVLLHQRDTIQQRLRPSVRPDAPQTQNCALSGDIYFATPQDRQDLQRLMSLIHWAKWAGASLLSLPVFSSTAIALCGALPLFFHSTAQHFMRIYLHRSDILAFVLNPLGERRRIADELSLITRELILTQSSYNPHGRWAGQFVASADKTTRSVADAASSTIRLARRFPSLVKSPPNENTRNLQLLVRIGRLRLVEPFNLSSHWHRRLVRYTGLMVKSGIVVAFSSAVAMAAYACYMEACEATRLRLEELECQRWRRNGTRLATNHYHLDALESAAGRAAYLAHDGSSESFYSLVLTVELWHTYFTFKRLMFFLETGFISLFLTIQSLCHVTIFLLATVDKIIWLRQLEDQIGQAASVASQLAARRSRADCKNMGPAAAAAAATTTNEEDGLMAAIMVAYLNYELFRRQHKSYQLISTLIMARIFMTIALGLGILYFMGAPDAIAASNALIVYCYILIVASVNLFLLTSSYKSKQIDSIMHSISQLLAHCSLCSLHLSYPLDLWRRQVRSMEETSRQYAISLLGVRISYQTVISFNAYAIALVLLMLRVWTRG